MSSSRQPQPRRTSGRTLLACEPCRKRKSKCDGEKPICGTCRSHGVTCLYEPARPTRRQKYWDRDYVQSLEDQVKLLSEALKRTEISGSQSVSPSNHESPESPPTRLPYGPKLLKALEAFGTMDWSGVRNKDGTPVLAGPARFSIKSDTLLPTFEDGTNASPATLPAQPEYTDDFIVEIEPNVELKRHLKAHFLENINPFYKFVDPSWLNFSDLFPQNDTVLQLLYSSLFAAAAYTSPNASREMADSFMAYAESLVQQCYLQHLCLPVLQALLIIAWYKHMIIDTAKGNLYHYMAVGLSIHLGIKETEQIEHNVNDVSTMRTFWAVYFLDRIGTPKMGFPSAIPWDIDRVARYIETVPIEAVDIQDLAFEYHCQLFALQEKYIDVMYMANFRSLPASEKQSIYAKANNAFLTFRKQIDRRLYVGRNTKPHKTQVVFWISYHAVLINLQRPLLDPTLPDMAHNVTVAFRTATVAATAVTRLIKTLQASRELKSVPPFVVYQVFRTALVHGLNLLADEEAGSQRTSGNFWVCLRALGELSGVWKELGETNMPYVLIAMRAWGLETEVHAAPGEDDQEYSSDEAGEDDLVGEVAFIPPQSDDREPSSTFM